MGVTGACTHTCVLCGHQEYEEIPALPQPEPLPEEEPEEFLMWLPAVAAGGCVLLLVLAGSRSAAKRRSRSR